MAMRKYQSVEKFVPLQGDQKVAASRISSSKSRLEQEEITPEDRRLAEDEHRKASAKLASESPI